MNFDLSKSEIRLVSELRNGLKVLSEIEGDLIPTDARRGTFVVFCGDGDRAADTLTHHWKCHDHKRHHLVSAAGGPIAGMWGKDERLAEEIDLARRLKSIETIVLIAHAPCAMARAEGMTIPNVLDALFARKDWVKRKFPVYANTKGGVVCHLHVDDGTKMRTYHACKDAWMACRGQFQ